MSKRFQFVLEEAFQGEEETFTPEVPDEFGDEVAPSDEFGMEGDAEMPEEGAEDMEGLEGEEDFDMGEEMDAMFDKMADFLNALDAEDIPEEFRDTFNDLIDELSEYEEEGEEDLEGEEMPEDSEDSEDDEPAEEDAEEMPEEDEEEEDEKK